MDKAPQIPVSVIIPCYRCAATIERTLQSVVTQTNTPAEIILIEDASGDDTYEILLTLQKKFPNLISVVKSEINKGASSARNLGWQMALQPYIAFLDADDAWHPQKLEIQYNYMVLNPAVSLSGHDRRLLKFSDPIPDWSIDLQDVVKPKALAINLNQLLVSNRFVTPSVMLKRNLGIYFEESQRHMEDHRLWLEILLGGHKIAKLELDLVGIYKPMYGASGLSSNLWLMEKDELGNFRYFYRTKRISFLKYNFLTLFSLVKFLKRIATVYLIRPLDTFYKLIKKR